MGEARDDLRQATTAAHRRLDENPLVAGLAAGTLSEADYARMLSAYLAFYQAWEEQMKANFPDLVELAGPERFLKTHWLLKDLTALGSPADPRISGSPATPSNRARAAGSLYVVEGSTIGGMHLSRSGKLPAHAHRFFEGYGAETMPKWKALIELLEALLPDEESRREAAEEASATFAWFQHRLAQIASACFRGAED
ncbi:MAG: biliverdin-producing heme oxygenase [Akkermansiaceae bacterium]|nr:biliverdin-producing heme oxygenase [Akkermansiaceae bacterium]